MSKDAVRVTCAVTAMHPRISPADGGCSGFPPFEESGAPSVKEKLHKALTEPVIKYAPHDGKFINVTVTPNGKYLLTESGDCTARLWDLKSGKQLHEFPHHAIIQAIAFTPDSKYLATGSHDCTARLWDLETGKKLHELPHDGIVQAVAFTQDSAYLATGSGDCTARLWDRETGEEIRKFPHDDMVQTVAFTPDSKFLVTGSGDCTPRLWALEWDVFLMSYWKVLQRFDIPLPNFSVFREYFVDASKSPASPQDLSTDECSPAVWIEHHVHNWYFAQCLKQKNIISDDEFQKILDCAHAQAETIKLLLQRDGGPSLCSRAG